jgi:hypothetical protein
MEQPEKDRVAVASMIVIAFSLVAMVFALGFLIGGTVSLSIAAR